MPLLGVDWFEASIPWTPLGFDEDRRDAVATLTATDPSTWPSDGRYRTPTGSLLVCSSGPLHYTSVRTTGAGIHALGHAAHEHAASVFLGAPDHHGHSPHLSRLDLQATSPTLPSGAKLLELTLDGPPEPSARVRPDVATRCRDSSWNIGAQGRAFYLGSPSSLRMLRVYDKTHESAGKIEGNRWEIQLRDEAADHAWLRWHARDDPGKTRFFWDLIDGFVSWRQGSSGRAFRRRAAWWQAIVGDVTPWRVGSSPRASDLASTIAYLARTWSPLLDACQSLGIRWSDLTNEQETALSSTHETLLAALRAARHLNALRLR